MPLMSSLSFDSDLVPSWFAPVDAKGNRAFYRNAVINVNATTAWNVSRKTATGSRAVFRAMVIAPVGRSGHLSWVYNDTPFGFVSV